MIENCYLIIRPCERKRTPDWYETDGDRTSIKVYDPVFEASKLIAKKQDVHHSDETKEEKGQTFEKFTKIFGPSSSIHEVYIASSVSDYVRNLFEGKNQVCLFYGQTGSGKTFNLMGENNYDLEKSVATSDRLDNPQDTRGLIVRMVKNLFKEISRVCEGDKDREENYRLTANFYDIYLDKVRDIGKYVNEQLNDCVSHEVHTLTIEQIEKHFINVQEKADGSINMKNLTNIEIQNSKDIAFIIDKGVDIQEIINRKLNYNSAVVHTILSLTFRNDEDDQVGKICFIRSAGSEWNSKHPPNDQRGEESIILSNSFNSLSKIVNLIKARKYAEENKEKLLDVQLSYQDSKFTKILQNVLTPDFKLTVFATLHSGDSFFNDSLQTLRYCNKIRGISLATSNKCMFSQKMFDEDDDEEQMKNEAMLNKITMENLELKGYIENQKKVFNDKLTKLQEILGLNMSVDAILNCKPNTKEANNIKKLRETRERAETLENDNSELNKKMEKMRYDLDENNKELQTIKEKHSQQILNANRKVDQLKIDLKDEKAKRENCVREQYRDRLEEMHQVMNHSQQVLEEKVSVVHKLNNSIVKKVNNYERVNEMKDLGKREAHSEYKKMVDEQSNQHKKELTNLKNQYEYLLSEKEKEFEKFVNEFKVYHSQK